MRQINEYLSIYYSSNDHKADHSSSKPTLNSKQQSFVTKNLSSTPYNIAKMMINDGILHENELNSKRRLIGNYVYNTRKKTKIINKKEWNLQQAKQLLNTAAININCLDDALKGRQCAQ